MTEDKLLSLEDFVGPEHKTSRELRSRCKNTKLEGTRVRLRLCDKRLHSNVTRSWGIIREKHVCGKVSGTGFGKLGQVPETVRWATWLDASENWWSGQWAPRLHQSSCPSRLQQHRIFLCTLGGRLHTRHRSVCRPSVSGEAAVCPPCSMRCTAT